MPREAGRVLDLARFTRRSQPSSAPPNPSYSPDTTGLQQVPPAGCEPAISCVKGAGDASRGEVAGACAVRSVRQHLRTMSDVTIRLGSAEELFVAPPGGDLTGPFPRLRSGVDELLGELRARRLGSVSSVTVTLPGRKLAADSEQRIRDQIDKYCELRLRETDNELRAMRQEAVPAFVIGMIVLISSLAVAALILHSSAPRAIRSFFGEGLFVVIAWVGAWYPLDLLIHYTRPHSRTKKLLGEIRRIDIRVVASDSFPTPT
jgi:hypothetical protein